MVRAASFSRQLNKMPAIPGVETPGYQKQSPSGTELVCERSGTIETIRAQCPSEYFALSARCFSSGFGNGTEGLDVS